MTVLCAAQDVAPALGAHASLRSRCSEIRDYLEATLQGRQPRSWAELADQVGRFRCELEAHFTWEESGAFYAALPARDPVLRADAERLVDQHDGILRAVRITERELEILKPERVEQALYEEIVGQLRGLLRLILRHEGQERAVLEAARRAGLVSHELTSQPPLAASGDGADEMG
jgi:hypothetical protein